MAVQHIQAATTRSRQELARGDIIPDNVQNPPEPVDDVPRQFLTVPTEKELWSQLLPEGIKIHLKSRPLGGLDPVSKWPPRMNIEWKKAVFDFTPTWATALDAWEMRGDELALLNATLLRMALPSSTLVKSANLRKATGKVIINFTQSDLVSVPPIPITLELGQAELTPTVSYDLDWTHPDGSHGDRAADRTVKKAIRQHKTGRTRAAAKTMVSNGVAHNTPEVDRILGSMHPRSTRALVLPPNPGPDEAQVNISPAQCASQQRFKASGTQCSQGYYGWSHDLFLNLRAKSLRGRRAFLEVDSRFTAMIANGNLPKSVAFLLTFGSLSAFHKKDKPTQDLRQHQGLPPLIRPVCNGPLVTKDGLRMLISGSKEGKAMKKRLLPIQMGLGAKAGPETVAHTFTALREAGWIIISPDASNGFNELHRQAMLDKVKEEFPEGMKPFNTLYGFISPVFFEVEDEPGTTVISVHLSEQGPRMGCVAGSPGFDITMNSGYRTLAEEFPEAVILA